VRGGDGAGELLDNSHLLHDVINVVVNVLDDLAVVLVRGQVMIELNHDAVVVKAAQAFGVGEADGAVVKVAWCLEGVGYGGGAPLLLVSLKEQRLLLLLRLRQLLRLLICLSLRLVLRQRRRRTLLALILHVAAILLLAVLLHALEHTAGSGGGGGPFIDIG